MKSDRWARRLALVAGGSAIIAMGALTAGCSGTESPAPSSTSTTTTTSSVAPSPTPTEKSINPTGGNSFSPPVKAPPLPSGNPGNTSHTG
jgi:ABC-type glycerol-3-phosphate transport system substrate-binding protein